MNEKIKDMIYGLSVLQSAGAGDMLNNQIELAIDIHCELNGVDKEQFLKDYHNVQVACWSTYEGDHGYDTWDRRQDSYKRRLIELLECKI